jgi:hypothetical protein
VPVADTLKRELQQKRNMPLLTELGNVLGWISTKMSPLNGAWFVAASLHDLTQQQPGCFWVEQASRLLNLASRQISRGDVACGLAVVGKNNRRRKRFPA